MSPASKNADVCDICSNFVSMVLRALISAGRQIRGNSSLHSCVFGSNPRILEEGGEKFLKPIFIRSFPFYDLFCKP